MIQQLQLPLNHLWYKIMGPTTKHFELEVYLWLASLLFTISSWQGLYKGFPPLRLLLIVGIASLRPLFSRWFISHYNPRLLSAGHVMEVTEVTPPTLLSIYWTRYWPQWMPPLPAFATLLPISVLLLHMKAFWNLEEKGDTISWNLLAMEHRPDSNLPGPAGFYSTERPDWRHVFFYFTVGGIMGSILVFGRLFPPLPDFVAGSTVYQTIKSTYPKQTSSPSTITGPERFRPVTNCDRLDLHLKLLALRLLETVCVCGWLPRSEWMLRFLRQRNTMIGLEYFLFFAGITEPRRKDIPEPLSDSFSAVWSYASLVSATVFLLVAQSLLTDRSYLSTLAFWSTEWKLTESQQQPQQASLWDARHKYKPGDVCVYNNLTYQAVLHHPQGPPMRRSTRWMNWLYEWLQAEVGHGVMHSRIWSELLRIQSILVMVFLALWCFASSSWSSGLGTAFLAHLVVWYGLVQVGSTDYVALQKLATEVQVTSEIALKVS
jgi:hypothetical protein